MPGDIVQSADGETAAMTVKIYLHPRVHNLSGMILQMDNKSEVVNIRPRRNNQQIAYRIQKWCLARPYKWPDLCSA